MKRRISKNLWIFIILIFSPPFTQSASNLNIRKCCELDEYLDLDADKCVKSDQIDPENNFRGIEIGRPICNSTEAKIRTHRVLNSVELFLLPGSWFTISEAYQDNKNESETRIAKYSEICIDRTFNHTLNKVSETFILELCIPECSPSHPCIRKCCNPHQILDMERFSCVNFNYTESTEKDGSLQPWDIIMGQLLEVGEHGVPYESVNNQLVFDNILQINSKLWEPRKNHSLRISHSGEPSCSLGAYEVDFRDKENYKRVALLPSGHLLIEPHQGNRAEIPSHQFCIDWILSENKSEGQDPNVNSQRDLNSQNKIAIVCIPDETPSEDALKAYRPILYPILMGTSSLFLLCTSIVYAILWKDLNLPGWLQLSYTNCLFVAFTLLTIVQVWTNEIHAYSESLCKVVGYTLHASFLSSFFWLTSMNIDLWCSFRNTTIMTSFGKSRGRRRYIGFAAFSLLIPIGVTMVAVIGDNGASQNSLITTEIGQSTCALHIDNKLAHLFYFYGVVGLLLLINLMFFFCTVLCLRERHRETKFAHRQCTAPDSADLLRFRLFTRLFFIMGILWIFELLSWLTHFLQLSEEIQSIFVVTDCLNALQGVAIFVIFVWKPHTWKQLRKKFKKIFVYESQASIMGPHTIKSSMKSSTKSGGSCKASSPT